MFKWILGLDQKFAWSFLGAFFSLLFGVFGIYTVFFYERKPVLQVDVTTNTPVLDVHADVADLQITYKGIDLASKKQALRLATAKFQNSGSASILHSLHDPDEPVTLVLSTGTFLPNPELLDASNSYLERSAKASLVAGGERVSLDPVILDPGDWFTFKFLILCDASAVPALSIEGKIAGMPDFLVTEAFRAGTPTSPFLDALRGGLIVQIIRLLAYTIAAFVLLMSVALMGAGFSSSRRMLRERRFRKWIQVDFPGGVPPEVEYVLKRYLLRGTNDLAVLSAIVNDPESTRQILTRMGDKRKTRRYHVLPEDGASLSAGAAIEAIGDLAEAGWLNVDTSADPLTPQFREGFSVAIAFLIRHGQLRKDWQVSKKSWLLEAIVRDWDDLRWFI